MDLGLRGSELGQNPAEAERFFAQRGPHPVVTGGRRVAFVEHEINDFEHRREPGGELVSARHFEGDVRFGEGPLGADDSLRDGRLGDEKRARDLVGGQTAEQAKRERDARFGRENRMTGDEHEAKKIVAHVVVEGRVEIERRCMLPGLDLAAELFMLALEHLVPAEKVDRAMLGGGHEPRARIVRDARLGPLLKRRNESVLGQLFGAADIADDAHEAGDEPRRFDSPDGIDGTMGIGSGHCYRSYRYRRLLLCACLGAEARLVFLELGG